MNAGVKWANLRRAERTFWNEQKTKTLARVSCAGKQSFLGICLGPHSSLPKKEELFLTEKTQKLKGTGIWKIYRTVTFVSRLRLTFFNPDRCGKRITSFRHMECQCQKQKERVCHFQIMSRVLLLWLSWSGFLELAANFPARCTVVFLFCMNFGGDSSGIYQWVDCPCNL